MEKYKEFILPYNIIFINKQSPYIIQHIKADLLHYQGGDKIANCITRDPYDIFFLLVQWRGKTWIMPIFQDPSFRITWREWFEFSCKVSWNRLSSISTPRITPTSFS